MNMNLETSNINLIEVRTDLTKFEQVDRFLAHHLNDLSRSRI